MPQVLPRDPDEPLQTDEVRHRWQHMSDDGITARCGAKQEWTWERMGLTPAGYELRKRVDNNVTGSWDEPPTCQDCIRAMK